MEIVAVSGETRLEVLYWSRVNRTDAFRPPALSCLSGAVHSPRRTQSMEVLRSCRRYEMRYRNKGLINPSLTRGWLGPMEYRDYGRHY